MATTSQPRSLLSIARLNIARARVRRSIWSFVRIDQTCFGRSGGFAPVSLPLFQGTRFGGVGVAITSSCIVILLDYRHRGGWDRRFRHWNQSAFGSLRTWPDASPKAPVAFCPKQKRTQTNLGSVDVLPQWPPAPHPAAPVCRRDARRRTDAYRCCGGGLWAVH